MKRATAKGSLPVDFYPSFIQATTTRHRASRSRSSRQTFLATAYWASRNRIGVLVETHSWKDYPHARAHHSSHHLSLMEMAARDGKKWLAAAQAADQQAAKIGGSTAVLTYTNTPHVRTIEFRGYEYEPRPSAVSGALMTRYNDKRPQIWRIPLFDEVKPEITVTAPRGGYLVPPGYARMVSDKLALHGIEFRTLDQAQSWLGRGSVSRNQGGTRAGDVRRPQRLLRRGRLEQRTAGLPPARCSCRSRRPSRNW